MTPSHFIFNILQSFIDLLSATKLQSNKINVAAAEESWFGQNWMA